MIVIGLPQIQEAIDFYIKETGIDKDELYPIEDIKECDLNKETMCYIVYDSPNNKELLKNKEFDVWHGETVVHLTFREVLELDKINETYIIASTEY